MSDERLQILGSYRACGKLILLGEHFVVHGAPALALPLLGVSTEIEVVAGPCYEHAQLETALADRDRALAEGLVQAALAELGLGKGPGLHLRVRSSIPIGYGLGSSAAFSVALLGALARASGKTMAVEELRTKAHALEHLSHGRPSGIDDTVVSLQQPIWFCRGEPPRPLAIDAELPLVLAGSGRPGSTREAVARVAELRAARPQAFEELCRRAGVVVSKGRQALERGDCPTLGRCLDETHGMLQELGVSSPDLDRLVEAARQAGALGAKLTGSGLGGFVVALAAPGGEARLQAALEAAGADRVLTNPCKLLNSEGDAAGE